MFVEASYFAALAHRDQRRKDSKNTPYINHPLEVAYSLSKYENVTDEEVLSAAVLHDTIEDTTTSKDCIREMCGERVMKLVMEVTDDKSLSKVERKKLQIEHAKTISDDAKKIKMADKMSNVYSTIINPPEGWSPELCRGYVVWAFAVMIEMQDVAPNIWSNMQDAFDHFKIDVTMTDKELTAELENYYKLIE